MLTEGKETGIKIGRRGFIALSVATPTLALLGFNGLEHNRDLDQRVKEVADQDPHMQNLTEEEKFHRDRVDFYQDMVKSSRTVSERNLWVASRDQEEQDRKKVENMGDQRFSELESRLGYNLIEKLSPWALFTGTISCGLVLGLDLTSKLKLITAERFSYNPQRRDTHIT